MRTALSVLMLFAVAVAMALLAGNNQGTVTLFWPPYRIDLSLNLVLLMLAGVFLTMHFALRAAMALFSMPVLARRWRAQQRERAVFVALLDALLHLVAGRFIRARKSAELALVQQDLMEQGVVRLPFSGRLRTMAHLLAAESAHSLLDKEARATHFQQALQVAGQREGAEAREGVQLRAARWAMDDRDAAAALQWLDDLPQGAARRTAALRLRLKAARMAGQTASALETARLLSKHRAFSEATGQSILRGLVIELILATRDPGQLERVWRDLDDKDRTQVDIATRAARHLLELNGDAGTSRQWLLPIWEQMCADDSTMEPAQRVAVIEAVAMGFGGVNHAPDPIWLSRIETAQMRAPGDALLQYLAGIACQHLRLWGKAQQLLNQSLLKLRGSRLERSAWVALASLAQERGDAAAATEAWRNALNASQQGG
jgi:HemY protein